MLKYVAFLKIERPKNLQAKPVVFRSEALESQENAQEWLNKAYEKYSSHTNVSFNAGNKNSQYLLSHAVIAFSPEESENQKNFFSDIHLKPRW